MRMAICNFICFLFDVTATTEIYTLSLHDALPISGLRFTFPGERFTMVLFHFKFLPPLLKVERRCFGFLDECCPLHNECCILWISILRTAITVVSLRVTGAITSQNEARSEFYGLNSCKPSTDSSKPKKGYPNLNRVSEVFWPSFFHHVNFTLKRDHRCWSSIYLPWRAVHHGTVPFQIPADRKSVV